MSRYTKLAVAAGVAALLMGALFAGQALAQRAAQAAGSMTLGPGRMGGGMMTGSGLALAPSARAGVAAGQAGATVTPTAPGLTTPGGMMGGMMAAQGLTGTLPLWMQQMMASRGLTETLPLWMRQMMASRGLTETLPLWMQQMMGAAGVTQTVPFSGQGTMGHGMMGQGMMGSGMMGSGMMGMMGGWSDPNARPLGLEQAQAAAQKYVQSLPNNAGANLAPLEAMEFANGFYVAIGDKSAGTGAMELLVDRYSGAVSPEPGPNMMWNTKYGMMSGTGMMGMMGLWTPQSGKPTVTEEQARTNAQQFLDTKFPGAKLPEDIMAFPGYYTLDFEVNGQPAGMLSVNGFTGQVWYHTWHGQFLSESGS